MTNGVALAMSLAGAVAVAAVTGGVAGCALGRGTRALLGRLRRGARVPPGWCEAGIGGLWAVTAAAWAAGVVASHWLAVLLGLSWLVVAAGAVDVLQRRLPDVLTLPALPLALLLLLPAGHAAVLSGVAGAALAAAGHAVVHLLDRRAVGAGDVKLAAPLGAVLAAVGWPALVLGAVLAALLTGLVAVAGLVTGRVARGTALPHGPSMLVAAWMVAVWLIAFEATGGGVTGAA